MSVLLFYLSLFVLGLGAHGLLGAFSLVYLGEDGHDLARWFARLGLVSAYRPVLSVNASSELTLKQRAYDEDLDREKVTYGGGVLASGVTRYLRDPQARLRRFLGVRFGFVDEFSGLVFDPRDADAGARAREHDEAGTLKFQGTAENGRLTKYIQGVFGLKKGTRGVDLRRVRHLTGGSAHAQAVDYLIEMYKTSQEPRGRGLSVWKMLAPVAALIAVLFLGAKLGGSGGGGGGGGTTVGVGQWLLLALSSRLPFKQGRQRKLAGVLTIVGVVFTTLLFMVFPAGIAWRALIAFALGLGILPGVAFFLGKSLGALGLAFAKLYLIIAFFGFDQPVIHLDSSNEYHIMEYNDLPDHVNDPEWYRFAKTWLGVTYANSDGVWPGRDSTIPADQLDAYQYNTEEVTPGLVASSITSANHTGLIPKRADPNTVYVQTKNVLSSFRDVGRGGLLTRALKQAKEDHFGGNDMDDNTILYMTAGFAALGLVIDVVMFF